MDMRVMGNYLLLRLFKTTHDILLTTALLSGTRETLSFDLFVLLQNLEVLVSLFKGTLEKSMKCLKEK